MSKAPWCCPECGFGKDDAPSHSMDCAKVERSDLLIHVYRMSKDLVAAYRRRGRALDQVSAIQGKCAILRHENNKLRRANERLREGEK